MDAERESNANRRAGRPRDEQATARIMTAALALLATNGAESLTTDAIAVAAGVGKPTIYRRWPNVWALVVDALLAEVGDPAAVVERATTRESLAASLKLAARAFRGRQGKLLRPLIARAQFDDALRAALHDRWFAPRRRSWLALIQRGVERGELVAGLNADSAVDALSAPLYQHLLFTSTDVSTALSDAYVDGLVATLFAGLAPR